MRFALRPGLKDFAWVAGPKILAGGLQFLVIFVLLHHFDPARFGVLTVCLSGILLVDSIFGGATDSGVLRLAPSLNEFDPERSIQLQQAGFLLKFLLATLAAAPLLLFSHRIGAVLLQSAAGLMYLSVSLAALLGMLALRSAQMYYQINRKFVPYGVSELLNSLLKYGGTGILLYSTKPSPVAVLMIFAGAPLTVAALIVALRGKALLLTPISRDAVGVLMSQVKWFVAVSATGTVLARMDVLLVSSVGGVANAGIYSAAQTFSLIPQLIGSYIAVVFSPRIMPMLEAGTLQKLYRDFQGAIAVCALVLFLLAVVLLPRMVSDFFPVSFRRAGPAILVLLPSGLCALVNFPLTILLLLFTRPRFLIALDCAMLPVLFSAYLWVIPVYGVLGAATITTAAALVKTAIMQVSAWRLLHERQAQFPVRSIACVLPADEVPDAH